MEHTLLHLMCTYLSFHSITCEALGNPSPDIIWFKNGQNLASGATKYIHAGKSSVDIVILDASDAGIYTCMYVFFWKYLLLNLAKNISM